MTPRDARNSETEPGTLSSVPVHDGRIVHLSVDTVRSHLKHIYEKMHVRSRAEAVARYMTSKLGARS